MIQLNHNYNFPNKTDEAIPIKVIGVGSAGTNILDRIVLDGLNKADLIAINTDVQSLASSVAEQKVQLGRAVTRGLGTGGDPDLGYDAAYESADDIRQALRNARMIFVCAGLGGGTGSGAAPAVAQIARELDSLVMVFATLPFAFEGKRRMTQAQEALGRLREHADALICFENDRIGDMVAPKAGIHQAFAMADVTISQCVRSIVGLIQRPGLIRIGFDDLLSVLRGPGGRCLFGYGESDSENRAHDALKQALKSPLMNRGRNLADATHILVHVAGGPAMTLSEVEILMQDLGRHIHDHTQILFGTSVDGRMGNRLSITLISSLAAGEEVAGTKPEPHANPEPVMKSKRMTIPDPPLEQREEPAAELATERSAPADELIEEAKEATINFMPETPAILPVPEEPVIKVEAPPEPRVILPKKKPAQVKEPKPIDEKKVHAKQEVLQFEPVTRGRFEKSEPTIVEGQDLDIPTFLRKNVRVK